MLITFSSFVYSLFSKNLAHYNDNDNDNYYYHYYHYYYCDYFHYNNNFHGSLSSVRTFHVQQVVYLQNSMY
jgi:hypothetical protein